MKTKGLIFLVYAIVVNGSAHAGIDHDAAFYAAELSTPSIRQDLIDAMCPPQKEHPQLPNKKYSPEELINMSPGQLEAIKTEYKRIQEERARPLELVLPSHEVIINGTLYYIGNITVAFWTSGGRLDTTISGAVNILKKQSFKTIRFLLSKDKNYADRDYIALIGKNEFGIEMVLNDGQEATDGAMGSYGGLPYSRLFITFRRAG